MGKQRAAQRWQTLILVFGLTSLVEGIGVAQVFAFLPLYLRQLGVAPAEVGRWTGALSALTFVLGLPLVPFWGAWADRYGRRVIIARSAAVEAVVFLLVGASRTPWQLAGALLLVGFQLGNTGIMLAALREAVPKGRVGLAITLFGMTGPLGFALGPAAGGRLVDEGVLTLPQLFFLDVALSLGVVVLLLLGYREQRRPPSGTPAARQAWEAVAGIGRSPTTRRIFITFTLLVLGAQMASPFFALEVQRVHPQTAGLAGAVGFVAGTAALIGALLSPFAGALGDRFGFRGVLAVGVGIGAAALALFPAAPTVGTLDGLAVLYGAGRTAAQAMVFTLLATLTPSAQRASTLNLVYVPLYLGGIVGPAIAAVLVGAGLPAVFLAGAACFVAALLSALGVARTAEGEEAVKPSPG